MTKKEMFAQIIALATDATLTADRNEIIAFCEHEIELLSKKSATPTKPTKTQQENEIFKQVIIDRLAEEDRPMTIPELMEDPQLSGLTNQRISALLTQLKRADLVVRTEDHKRAYFSLNEK